MDYKQHTKQRFVERILSSTWLELSDDDYYKMCDISNNSFIFKDSNKNRVIIKYNDTFIWCVISKKSKIIKTIYPIDRRDKKRFLGV
jgi:hypothetical protein